MKKVIRLVVFVAMTSLCSSQAFAIVKYNPSDVETFLKTGKCSNCDLSGANLNGQTMANVDIHSAIMTETYLNWSNYASGNFSGVNMLSAAMTGGNFSGSNFSNSILNSAEMNGSNFSRCDFTGADFTGANLDHAILIQSKVTSLQLASAKTLSCAIMPDGTRHASDTGGSC